MALPCRAICDDAFSDEFPNLEGHVPEIQQAFSKRLKVLLTENVRPVTCAVALSGGADSMALALLTKAHMDAHGGHVITLTIDHQLRPESHSEALKVASWMHEQSMQHHILKIEWDQKPQSHIQELARKKRYQLLEAFCAQNGIDVLLTAHHANDVEETLIMRLWRGAGIEGLAGIPAIRKTEKITIVRPLLALKKSQLEDYLRLRNILWIEDPSNQSDDYERNRVRKLLKEFPLPEGQVARFVDYMAKAKLEIDEEGNQWLEEALMVHKDGTAKLDMNQYPSQEVITPLLSRMLMHISGEEKPPRGHEIERLARILKDKTIKRTTLSGLMFEQVRGGQWLVFREPARIPTQPLTRNIYWDKRFHIQLTAAASSLLVVKPLGKEGLGLLKKERVPFPSHVIYQAKLGLLSIWQLDQLVCVPHIDYWNYVVGTELRSGMQITFAPCTPLVPRLQRYLPLRS